MCNRPPHILYRKCKFKATGNFSGCIYMQLDSQDMRGAFQLWGGTSIITPVEG